MTNKEILHTDMLDILFEHRNKIYGAYALRREYHYRLGIALGITLTTVLFITLFASFGKNDDGNNNPFHDKGGVIISPYEEIIPEEPERPREPERPQPNSEVDYQTPIIVKNEDADEILPDLDAINHSEISNRNIDGNPPDGTQKPDEENYGNGNMVETPDPQPAPEPNLPSYPPAFPGGESAWLGFLRKFLQAPGELEPGERKEVIIRFWIDEEGAPSKFEIVKSAGSSFDKEVLRVMKKMPKWEPAVQNGRKVPAVFSQPVIFIGVQE